MRLGYPPYFILLLGVAKLSGVITLAVPGKLLRLKEWVFAGLAFDVIFAFISNIVIETFVDAIPALVVFIVIMVTYAMFRKLYLATYTATPI